MRITLVGGPTALLEFGPFRLLTDPVFDPPGRRYSFGWGTSSRKLIGPAVPAEALGRVDAVLLSHDTHADNLDATGRELLGRVRRVVTTPSAARRIGGDARGLRPWQSTTVTAGGEWLTVTATPARHGPPLSRPVTGAVTGFVIESDRLPGPVYISGDTVMYRGVGQVAERFDVDVAVLHLGGVTFPNTGPVRYTMTATDALRAIGTLRPRLVVPLHFEGWSHFREAEQNARATLERSPVPVRWPTRGQPLDLSVAGERRSAALTEEVA